MCSVSPASVAEADDRAPGCSSAPVASGPRRRDTTVGRVGWLLTRPLVALIVLYQRVVAPGLRPCCRFTPSCSEYARQALERHGLVRGLAKTLWRLARCHPLCRGGYDPP